MESPLAAGLFGIDLTRTQVLGLGLVLAGFVGLFFLLLWLSRTLRRLGLEGGGLLVFTALAYLPLLALYAVLEILEFNRVPQGNPPVLVFSNHAKALQFVLLVLGLYLAASFVDAVLFARAEGVRSGLRVPRIVRELLRWVVVTGGGFIAAAAIWDFHVQNVTIFTSAVTVAATIALGPTLGSLISGITLAAERPFEIGDWIEVEGKQGRVDQITWRSTRIVTRDHESVVFPNGKLAEWRIINISRPDGLLRIRAGVHVHYRTPPLEVREAIRRAVVGTPGVLERPEPVIRIQDFLESSVAWDIRVWIDNPENLENIRADVLQRIWYSFDRSGIEISFPVRNVVMREKGWEGRAAHSEAEEAERRRRNQELFRRIPLLATLPEPELVHIATRAGDEVYLDGERVTRQGEPGDRMFVVVGGKVKVAVDVKGLREVAELKEGDFFGEMSLLTGRPRVATVVAAGTLRVVAIRAEDLKPVLQKHPEFARDMAEQAAHRQMHLEELTAKLEERGPSRDLETTSSNLLQEIVKFFRLPGDAGRR